MPDHQKSLGRIFPRPVANQILATLLLAFLLSVRSAVASDANGAAESLQDSFNYALVGIAQFDGVAYASLIDRQTHRHFLLSTKKQQGGLTLTSITPDNDPSGPSATIQKNGVSVRLDLDSDSTPAQTESAPAPVAQDAAASTSASVLASLNNLPPPPTPPRGASLPLAFQAIDPKKMNLTEDQVQVISQVRQNFLNAVNGTATLSTPANTAAGTATASSPQSGGGSFGNTPAGNPSASTSISSSAGSTSVSDAAATSPASSSPAAANQNVTSDDKQLKIWQTAQYQSDEELRMLLGWQGFSQYEMTLPNTNAP